MFDKKSEYALNKHDQDSIIYICPIPLCGELRHLLVDEPLLLLRHPELIMMSKPKLTDWRDVRGQPQL